MRRVAVILLLCLAVAAGGTFVILRGNTGISDGEPDEGMGAAFGQMAGGPADLSAVDLVVTTEAPSLPDRVTVYKVVSPRVTADYVENIGRRLGLAGPARPAFTGSIGIGDTSGETPRELIVYTDSGAVEYILPDKWCQGTDSPPTLPSEEEAKTMAVDFLNQYNLLPSEIAGIRVIDGSKQYHGNSAGIEEWVTQLHVLFDREIDGRPVMGPGQKTKVFVEAGGITGFKITWRDVKPHRKVQLKSLEAALADMKKGERCQVGISGKDVASIKVQSVVLGYWMEAADTYQEYATPIYHMTGVCIDNGGKETGSFEAWCDAI